MANDKDDKYTVAIYADTHAALSKLKPSNRGKTFADLIREAVKLLAKGASK